MRFPSLPSRRKLLRDLQTDLISELERLGTPTAAIHFVITDLLAHDLRYAEIAQRVRRAKERRARHAQQATAKPLLKARAIVAYEARCAYCEQAGTPEVGPDGKPWTLDRINPGAEGGEYDPLNVALACHDCNNRKGARRCWNSPPSLAELEAA